MRLAPACLLVAWARVAAAQEIAPFDLASVSMNCTNPVTPVQRAVCTDSTLQVLDARMAAVFATVSKHATAAQLQVVIAQQERWVTQREECSIKQYIKTCLRQAYVARSSRLTSDAFRTGLQRQQSWTYLCDDGSTLRVEMIPGTVDQVKVRYGKSMSLLPHVETASGARYYINGVSVWIQEREVLFEHDNVSLRCKGSEQPPSVPPRQGATLPGTHWRLVEFRSSDDKIGVVRPDQPAKYTMSLGTDRRVAMRLDCNRGSGTWSATSAGPDNGSFRFGPLAMTRAFCQPPSMDTRMAKDAEYVRSYLLRDGRLFLDLMADAGTYVWEPSVPTPP